ncbi:MAG: hypothetical protein ACK4P3_03610 [Fimbriimonadaceae bacterium]
MKFFQYLLVLSLLTGFASVVTLGQRQPPPIQPKSPTIEQMIPPDVLRRLQLTADQARRLNTIFRKYEAESKRVQSMNLQSGQYASRLNDISRRMMQEVRGVLNDRQWKILDDFTKANERKARANMEARMDRNAQKVTITDKRSRLGLSRSVIDRMKLTNDQLKLIDVAAERTFIEFERINRQRLGPPETRTRHEAALKRGRDEVRRVLNQNQRRMYEQALKEQERQSKENWELAHRLRHQCLGSRIPDFQ